MKAKRMSLSALFLFCFSFLLTACDKVGEKSASLTVMYGVMAVLSLLLFAGYCFCIKEKERWFFVLFASVAVVNSGYFALAVSQTLEAALWANRVSYLGSVFLPLSMLMILLKTTRLSLPKPIPPLLVAAALLVFLVTASPGILTIYYQEVSLISINGASALEKVYGPWHGLYLVYLLVYFSSIIGVVVHAIVGKKLDRVHHVLMLSAAVAVNLGVWFIEQLIRIDFEILSVSYIISELFLLGLDRMMRENEKLKAMVSEQMQTEAEPKESEAGQTVSETQAELFEVGLKKLTPTERMVFDAYLEGKGTKEVLSLLDIKENTLKFHNKNLYGKLGVSSRKQLVEIGRQLLQTSVPAGTKK